MLTLASIAGIKQLGRIRVPSISRSMQPCDLHIRSESPAPRVAEPRAPRDWRKLRVSWRPVALVGLVNLVNAQRSQKSRVAKRNATTGNPSTIVYKEGCLRAQRDFRAGEVLLEESPLILVQDDMEVDDVDVGSAEDLWFGFRRHRSIKAAESFKLLAADCRTAVLSLFTPTSENDLQDWSAEKEASKGAGFIWAMNH